MNSHDRVDDNISFMFNASNISWHIIMKAFDQDKIEAKWRRKQKKRNPTRTWLVFVRIFKFKSVRYESLLLSCLNLI